MKGICFEQLAEGSETVRAMHLLAKRYRVELPICEAVYRVLYEKKDAAIELDSLLARNLKNEF